jgi:hypothetical protein
LQRGNLDLLPAQQDVLVIRRAQALQQGGDGAVAGVCSPRSIREMVVVSQMPSHNCRWVSPRSFLRCRM